MTNIIFFLVLSSRVAGLGHEICEEQEAPSSYTDGDYADIDVCDADVQDCDSDY